MLYGVSKRRWPHGSGFSASASIGTVLSYGATTPKIIGDFVSALKSTGSADQLRTGVELIVKQMEEALRSLNVQTVETVGATFDPRVHEALEMVEKEDVPDHQVFDEVRRGYRIKERLLRPALVRVASNSQQKEA